MLNSRYAPVIALAVLAAVIIAVAGFFLAISPQRDEASRLRTEAQDVRSNTVMVEQASAKLDEWQAVVAADNTVDSAIDLNAPTRLDIDGFRARLWAALGATGVEIGEYSQGDAQHVDGWMADPATLASSQVAALFQIGPRSAAVAGDAASASADGAEAEATAEPVAPTTSGSSSWTPVIAAPGAGGAVAQELYMVPFTLTLYGTTAEQYAFLQYMADPASQIFQVYEVTMEARPSGAGTVAGVSDAADGDATTTVVGALYVNAPDRTVIDEGVLQPSGAPSAEAFKLPPNATAQPGA